MINKYLQNYLRGIRNLSAKNSSQIVSINFTSSSRYYSIKIYCGLLQIDKSSINNSEKNYFTSYDMTPSVYIFYKNNNGNNKLIRLYCICIDTIELYL